MEKIENLRRCGECGLIDKFWSEIYHGEGVSFICEPCFMAMQERWWEEDYANGAIDEATYRRGKEKRHRKVELANRTEPIVETPFPTDTDRPRNKTSRH